MARGKRGGAGNRFERKASALALSIVVLCCMLVVLVGAAVVVVVVVVVMLCAAFCVPCDVGTGEMDVAGGEAEEATGNDNDDEEAEEEEAKTEDEDDSEAVVAIVSLEELTVVGIVRGAADVLAGVVLMLVVAGEVTILVASVKEGGAIDPFAVSVLLVVLEEAALDISDDVGAEAIVAALCACNSLRMLWRASSRLRCVSAKTRKTCKKRDTTNECTGAQSITYSQERTTHSTVNALPPPSSLLPRKKAQIQHACASHAWGLPRSSFDFNSFCLIASNDSSVFCSEPPTLTLTMDGGTACDCEVGGCDCCSRIRLRSERLGLLCMQKKREQVHIRFETKTKTKQNNQKKTGMQTITMDHTGENAVCLAESQRLSARPRSASRVSVGRSCALRSSQCGRVEKDYANDRHELDAVTKVVAWRRERVGATVAVVAAAEVVVVVGLVMGVECVVW